MTNNEIITALRAVAEKYKGKFVATCETNISEMATDAANHIERLCEENNFLKAEIERLNEEVSKARRKALLEAKGKFVGHSDYHGDTILCKLICMAEGKEVGIAKPLDTNKLKSKARKELAGKLKAIALHDGAFGYVDCYDIDNVVKEMEGK